MMKKAGNRMAFGKIGFYGDAGSGKTFTAAQVAIGLHQFAKLDKPVAMFDTEPSASFIAPLFEKAGIEFLVEDETRALIDLLEFMDEAEKNCSIVIIDSITHVWRKLQQDYLDMLNNQRKKYNKPLYAKLEFQHWGPIKEKFGQFTDRFLSSKLHCIVCGRAGAVYEYQDNEKGKKELITVGTKMASEKEMGYEPSLLIEMSKVIEHGKLINRAFVEKDRANLLNGHTFDFPTFENFKPHLTFLNIGGEHFGSMDKRESQSMFKDFGEETFSSELRNREIWLEEISNLLAKVGLGGSTNEAKLARIVALEKCFGTASKTKLETLNANRLKEGLDALKLEYKDHIGMNPAAPLEDVPQ